MICYGGTKIQSTNFVQRNVKNIKRRRFLFLQKNSKNYAKSVYFLQFAFNNQNFAQTKEQICSRVSPLLETLYPKDFNKYLPQDLFEFFVKGCLIFLKKRKKKKKTK